MKKLFKRNYDAVVKRGKITHKTSDFEFLDKLNEEFQEVKDELSSPYFDLNNERINEEIADCLNVCCNWLIHRGVNLKEILTKIAEKNEKRANNQ